MCVLTLPLDPEHKWVYNIALHKPSAKHAQESAQASYGVDARSQQQEIAMQYNPVVYAATAT